MLATLNSTTTVPSASSPKPIVSLTITGAKTFTAVLTTLGTLLLASLVWLEQKTGLVLKAFALYDEYPDIIHYTLLATCVFLVVSVLIFFGLRLISRPQPKWSPGHQRKKSLNCLPGMDVEEMARKWKTKGMEEPLVALRPFGQRGPVQKMFLKVLSWGSRLLRR
jgi:hypothetical protein